MNKNLITYLADDHEIVAAGLASIIKSIDSIQHVKVFNNGKKLFNACSELAPDIIFLDYEMPEWDGEKTLLSLKERYPAIPVIMLSMINEKKVIMDCISKGACGFLNKNCSLKELEDAIFSAFEGKIYYSREALLSISGVNQSAKNQEIKSVQLSIREMEVLKLLCDGLSPKEIAQKLFISPRTSETHKKNIMEKFDVNSIAKLISIAIRSNVIKD